MRVDLHAATDVAQYVLFDPAAIPEWIRHDLPFPSGPDWLEEPATRGNLLDFRAECDGDLRARLYVDEVPEQRLMQIAVPTLTGAILNVPSGKIWFIGAECLIADSEENATAETYCPTPCPGLGAGMNAIIPAGAYSVSAFQIDSKEIEEQTLVETGPDAIRRMNWVRKYESPGCSVALWSIMISAVAFWTGLTIPVLRQVCVILGCVGLAVFVVQYAVLSFVVGSESNAQAFQTHIDAIGRWPGLVLHLQSNTESGHSVTPTPGILTIGCRGTGESTD
jgi:aryl carrier-like protein